MKKILFAVAVFLIIVPTDTPWAASGPSSFVDVNSFLKSIPGVETTPQQGAYGELDGVGKENWAGMVYANTSENQERSHFMVILAKGNDGRFRVALMTEPSTSGGGTGNHAVGLAIRKRSLFVESEWNWHGCGGGATHQFKFRQGEWRLVGATFSRSSATIEKNGRIVGGETVIIDTNILTGETIDSYREGDKKPVVTKSWLKPAAKKILLKDYEEDLGMPEGFGGANC